MAPRKKLKGLVAATITPMTPDGKINLPVIRQYVDYLVNEQNVKNIFVNGTTGEGLSLSIQERKQLAEEWMCQGKDKLDHVIIHVGALNLPECQELARHAAAIGADGIAVIAPFFFKPTNKDELIAFMQKVASEAPEVPFYYYHIPPLTGVKIRVEELLDGIKAQIPTFQGVKFSDTDLLDLAQCIHKNETGEFEFLYGVDEQLLGALALGANGAVGRSVCLGLLPLTHTLCCFVFHYLHSISLTVFSHSNGGFCRIGMYRGKQTLYNLAPGLVMGLSYNPGSQMMFLWMIIAVVSKLTQRFQCNFCPHGNF
ncbi:N-acetylneuraminate lyase isoform X1 [Melospiza georgiana]|uniref:N-acetylneuraminate lyase isoform X1 n=1 Tax=Melospiza georgiana TaxID=44398 RepID=UPI0025AB98ED|nr:N-acetylneuraminate lyase isoform X1 [Melospiza georgiana]XP_057885938.1 N-acetylneuraminate lyase isoform X1 [Melospiza georgiana]